MKFALFTLCSLLGLFGTTIGLILMMYSIATLQFVGVLPGFLMMCAGLLCLSLLEHLLE
jgi:hypothetical protein